MNETKRTFWMMKLGIAYGSPRYGRIRPAGSSASGQKISLETRRRDDKARSQSNATYDRLRHRQRLIGDDWQRR